jgi:hypothetical protein
LAHQLEATPVEQPAIAAEPARGRRLPDPSLNPAPAYQDPVTAAA